MTDLTTGAGPLRRSRLAKGACLALTLLAPAGGQAQSILNDPYAAGAQAGATGATYGAQTPATGAAPGATAAPGAAYVNSGNGVLQGEAQSGAYGPTAIGDPATGPDSLLQGQPAYRPGADDQTTVGALYARPGDRPGQFQLYRRPPPALSEFETFVKESLGRPLPRFGASLVLDRQRSFALPPTTTVPPDYALNPGDELVVGVTGSVEANLRLTIDSQGRIFIPKIGAVNVAGVRYGDLADAISRKIGEQYKKTSVSVVIGRLHGLTVYVTGFAVTPGAYTVSSLSTMANALLAAGGPSAGGSFRTIQLRRGGQLVSTLDLYDLILNGDRGHDATLQNGDILNIGPVGPELAVTGSVNAEAIFEAKPGETLGDMIRFAGGANTLADTTRVIVARLGDLDAQGSRQLDFATAAAYPAERGDIVRVLSLGRIARPEERQAILATIEGEVDRPGQYYLRPGATLGDLVARAGGLTSGAYPFAMELDRDSIRRTQALTFNRAIDDLELAAAVAPLSERGRTSTIDSVAAGAARSDASLAVIERLRQRKPDGRLVLNLPPDAVAAPASVLLENNDHISIPPRPKTVGVFGAVYRPGSFLFGDARTLGDYLKLAGGPQHYADRGDIYVVLANGAVISLRENHGVLARPALPGDVIFVPVRTSPSAWQRFLDLSAVVYQFGVSALTIKALGF